MREDHRLQAQIVGFPVVVIALVVIGRLWGRTWVVHESCALTGCQPESMAFIGWATQAALPAFGLVAISGQRRTQASGQRLWITAALVGIPGLVFLPARHDRWVDLAFHGPAGPRAFGVGLVAAWLALASLVLVMPLVLWLEDKAYLRARQRGQISAEGSNSIRLATRFLIGYAVVAALAALAIAESLTA